MMPHDVLHIDTTRRRTAKLYNEVAKLPTVPTPLLDLLQTLIHRLNDLEESNGYVPPTHPTGVSDKVDTQGR